MIKTKEDYKEAVSETLEILQFADEEIINKIPLEVLKRLNSLKSITYTSKYKDTEKIDKEKISGKAKAILAVLYRDYICSEEERKEFDKLLEEKQKSKNNNHNLKEYNINRFDLKNTKTELENTLPIEVKKNFFKKILEKVFKY